MRVFVYASLKVKANQEKALGHDAKILFPHVYAPGWKEIQREGESGPWPTLETARIGQVHGEIFELSAGEINKLDTWESRYKREQIETSKGPAWAYFYREKT